MIEKTFAFALLSASILCAACGDPVDGKYTLKSATPSTANDTVFVEATATNDGSDDYPYNRCVQVSWEAAPGVSRDEAIAANIKDDSTKVTVIETQQQCGSDILHAGDSESFQFIAKHTREELSASVIVTVTADSAGTSSDDRINQPSP